MPPTATQQAQSTTPGVARRPDQATVKDILGPRKQREVMERLVKLQATFDGLQWPCLELLWFVRHFCYEGYDSTIMNDTLRADCDGVDLGGLLYRLHKVGRGCTALYSCTMTSPPYSFGLPLGLAILPSNHSFDRRIHSSDNPT